MKKQIVIFTGAGGCGKNAIIEGLLKLAPEKYEKIVSYTTRPKRIGEVDGVTYHYISDEEFENKINTGEIFEHTKIYGYCRGMSKTLIDKITSAGKTAIKDNDIIGVHEIRKAYPEKSISFFINVDRDTVNKRIAHREESDRVWRMKEYDEAMDWKQHCDFVIDNNGTLDEAVKKVHSIICQNNT